MCRALLAALCLSLLACTIPWRSYQVSFPIEATLVRSGTPVTSGAVRLQVRSTDNPALGGNQVESLGVDGRFAFDALALRVSGQERSKNYILLLTFSDEEKRATLWRSDYSRMRLGAPIELECDLDRPARQGPPCTLVSSASEQPWLLDAGANDYAKLCSSCHGEAGHGDGPSAAYLAPPPADLTRIAERHDGVFPRRAIADWIDGRSHVPGHGQRQMPVWGIVLSEQTVPGGFSEERIRIRIDILVLYLETLQQPPGPR